MSTWCGRALVGVALLVVMTTAEVAPAAPRTSVECELDVGARTVAGRVRVDLANPSPEPLDRVYLWLYPNRLARRSPGINDVNFYWVYPRHFDPGGMRLEAVTLGQGAAARAVPATSWHSEVHAIAGRDTLWAIELPNPIAPGASVTLTVDYRADIPERYESFGCIDAGCTLAGGFYPMVAGIDESGWDLEGPPLATDMDVSVELSRPAQVVLFDSWSGERVTRFRAAARNVPYATLSVAPRFWESTRRVLGVDIRMLARSAPPPAEDARHQILPYTREDYPRYALDVVEQAFRLLSHIGAGAPAGTRITLVDAPLRMRLAAAHPGVVLLSDRWYRIWPAERFRKFHRRELVRSAVAEYFAARIARAGIEQPRDIDVAADLIGSYAMDLFTLQRYRKHEFAGDILRPVAFVPIIDQLLYAPQTMFSGVYFGSVLDEEPLRDQVLRFDHQRPRGRLYYEKLRDLLPSDALTRALQEMMAGRPFRAAAQDAYGKPLGWFFRQWGLPYPRVDYRLVGTESRRRADGQYDNAVTVARDTEVGDLPPIEPVQVLAVLVGGEKRHLTWDGRGGDRVTLRFVAPAAIYRVVVDPAHRLVESKLSGREQHPRFDNRDRQRMRFVYESFGVLLNVNDLSALLAADFLIGRVRDVKNQFEFLLFTSEDVSAGVTVGYQRAFGPTVDPATLMRTASLRLGVDRLNRDFFAFGDEQPRGASRFRLGLETRSDDRLFFYEPMHARALAFGLDFSLIRRDHDADPAADNSLLFTAEGSARVTEVFTPRANHTIALHLTAAGVVGNFASRTQLLTGGGNFGVRGFAPGALFGRLRLMSRTEYRHWFVHDLNWNLGHYNQVRGIGGALYFDVAALSPCGSYNLAQRDALYGALGYALRFPYDSFGTLPQLMRIDVAARLFGRPRECLGATGDEPPAVQIYVSFVPPF